MRVYNKRDFVEYWLQLTLTISNIEKTRIDFMGKQKRVLQDHKKRGKILTPPFVNLVGPLEEVSWVKTLLPELLWIALIQNLHGDQMGVELITLMTRCVREHSSQQEKGIFATTSSYISLSESEQERIVEAIQIPVPKVLTMIQAALRPLVRFYPRCPLRFLFNKLPNDEENLGEDLSRLKVVVEGLYDKYSKNTSMVQATAIWLAFDSGSLKANQGTALASFPEIEKYPDTELSEEVAASIRAAVLMLVGKEDRSSDFNWPDYFWNRGLQIDKCYFGGDLYE